jgi:c-di-GMP-binding flagellar brake protein YcgR
VKKGPSVGQFVHVIAPSGETIEARVQSTASAGLVLGIEAGGPEAIELPSDGSVSIEFTDRRGVCRMPATAEAAGITVLRVNATGKVELIQRRDYVRVEAFVPVTYQPIGPEGWTVTAHTLDISGGGFQIAQAEALRLGDMLGFTLELGEGDEPVHAVATAVREAGGSAFGMRFVEVLERERQRLIRWVFERERLARQIARHP